MLQIQAPRRIIPRHLESVVRSDLADFPVVTIVGPRQAGKSTLARELIRTGYDAQYVSLDDPQQLAAAERDPPGFVEQLSERAVIDEVQRVPELILAIKSSVDRDRRAGRFVITGSANVFTLPKVADSLVGRTSLRTLWPLSQGEIAGHRERFLNAVFSPKVEAVEEHRDIKRDVLVRALKGGFPEILQLRSEDAVRTWFGSYVTTVIQREIRDIRNVAGLREMPQILSLLAARSMSVLNRAELSRSLEMDARTLSRYLALLWQTYLIQLIPSWSGGLGRRLVRHPKVMISDTGLLGYLQQVDLDRFTNDPTFGGPILENFVAAELVRQQSWTDKRITLYHFRSHERAEVDLILERSDGMVVGVEVKSKSLATGDDLRGLRALAERSGKKFVRGILLYTGRHTLSYAKNLHIMPISALWKI